MRKLQRLIAVCAVVKGLGLSVALAASAQPQSQILISLGHDGQQTQSSETDDFLRAAFALYRQGKFDEAPVDLNKAAGLTPNEFRPHFLGGCFYSAPRKLNSPTSNFAAATRLQPL